MYLYSKLANYSKNINIAIVGCGKFISMFLAQFHSVKKIVIHSIIDIDLKKARNNCFNAGLHKNIIDEINFSSSIDALLEENIIDIFIEATGNARQGIINASKVIKSSKHIIMVNVEADAVAGKYLADLAYKYNVIYSMAYGDQPSLILEQIEWGLVNGFDVTAAGKGTKHHKSFKFSTPETVWDNYGISNEFAENAGMNPKMFNSFITGDKSTIEMVAVVNASHLDFPRNGLQYPAIGLQELSTKLIPENKGGILEQDYVVEVISSIKDNKNLVRDHLRWGVYIILKGNNEQVKSCFKEYGIATDSSGAYSALWRPYHYIGLELAQSIYSIMLLKQPTGTTKFYKADVATFAKKDLFRGDILDGEGGFTVIGKGVSAKFSKDQNILPLGLSDGVIVKKNIRKNELISVEMVETNFCDEIKLAREYQYNLLI